MPPFMGEGGGGGGETEGSPALLKREICLANASLDIAFHDTVSIDFCSTVALLLAARPEKNEDSKESDEYIKMFWVGLMDGDGSIQVNH